jgi:hypothetical protein
MHGSALTLSSFISFVFLEGQARHVHAHSAKELTFLSFPLRGCPGLRVSAPLRGNDSLIRDRERKKTVPSSFIFFGVQTERSSPRSGRIHAGLASQRKEKETEPLFSLSYVWPRTQKNKKLRNLLWARL